MVSSYENLTVALGSHKWQKGSPIFPICVWKEGFDVVTPLGCDSQKHADQGIRVLV